MIVNIARNVTDPSPALTLNMDDERFKCYLLDTGLLINLSFGDRKVIPVEAKSGKKYTTKSLFKFKTKYTNKVGLQYVLHEGDLKREGEVIYLPYYMAAVI